MELQSFYSGKDTCGKYIINKDLFDSTARDIAKSFSGKDQRNKTEGVSITQLRRLFDEVKRFKQILEAATGEDVDNVWQAQLPYIKMIKSKLSYTIARMTEKNKNLKGYYKEVSLFIEKGISLVNTKEDYFVFCSLFEAVHGFYYEHAPKDHN